MKAYERSLFSLDNSDMLYDNVGNFVPREELPDLSAIFCSKGTVATIPAQLDYGDFSVLLDEDAETTFGAISDDILSNMQKIEILLYQMLLQRGMTQQDFKLLEYYWTLEAMRTDGNISPEGYNQAITKIKADMMDPVIQMANVQTMHNSIYDELFHAEYRMIDGFNSQCFAIKHNTHMLAMGDEIRSFSPYADNTAYCYQDSLKAIFKALDVFSKWFFYISGYKNLKKKIPQAYFSDFLRRAVEKIEQGPFRQKVEGLCRSLEVFVHIRNEITHNESMERNRQILFIGRGTTEVNEKDLVYSKMLFWDHDEHALKRSSGSLGFFTQNLDTLVETKKYFITTIKLITAFQEYFFDKIVDELAAIGVERPWVWFGYPDMLQPFSIKDIKRQYNRFSMWDAADPA